MVILCFCILWCEVFSIGLGLGVRPFLTSDAVEAVSDIHLPTTQNQVSHPHTIERNTVTIHLSGSGWRTRVRVKFGSGGISGRQGVEAIRMWRYVCCLLEIGVFSPVN